MRFALELVPALLALVAAGGAEAKARLLGGGVPSSYSSSFAPPLSAPASSSLRKRSGRGVVLGLAAAVAAASGIANLFLDAATRDKVVVVAEARGYSAEAVEQARLRGKRRVDPTALLSARRGLSDDLEGAGIGNGGSSGGEAAAEAAEAKASAELAAARSPFSPTSASSSAPASLPSPPPPPPAYALRRPPLPPPPRNAFGDPLTLLVPPPVARYLRFALPGGSRPALRLARATQTGDFRFRITTGLRPDEGWKRVTATQTWNACASTPGYCWAATVKLAPGLWVRGWDALCGEYVFLFFSVSKKRIEKTRKKHLIEKKTQKKNSKTGGRGHMYWRLLGSLPLIDSDAAGESASAAAEAAKAEATEAAAREAAARAASEGRSPPAPPRPPQEVTFGGALSAERRGRSEQQQQQELVSPPGVDASAALRWLGESVYFPTALLPTSSSSSSSDSGGSLRWEPVSDHAARAVLVVAAPRSSSSSSSSDAPSSSPPSPPPPSRPPVTVSAVFHFGPGGEALSAKSHDRARPLEDGTVAEDAHTVEYSRWKTVPSLGLRVPLALDMRWDLVTPFPYGRLRIKEIEGAAVAGVGVGSGSSSVVSSSVCLETFDFEGTGWRK